MNSVSLSLASVIMCILWLNFQLLLKVIEDMLPLIEWKSKHLYSVGYKPFIESANSTKLVLKV